MIIRRNRYNIYLSNIDKRQQQYNRCHRQILHSSLFRCLVVATILVCFGMFFDDTHQQHPILTTISYDDDYSIFTSLSSVSSSWYNEYEQQQPKKEEVKLKSIYNNNNRTASYNITFTRTVDTLSPLRTIATTMKKIVSPQQQNQLLPNKDGLIFRFQKQHHHQQQQQQYQQHENMKKNCNRLEFVHIPKTAGTAVEQLANVNDVSWGNCHFFLKGCPHHHTKVYALPSIPVRRTGRRLLIKQYKMSPWHLPIQYFDIMMMNLTTTINNNNRKQLHPFQQRTKQQTNNHNNNNVCTFAIVRNPYDKLISEYYYRKSLNRRLNKSRTNYPRMMNNFISKRIKATTNSSIGSFNYFQFDGHYIPQYHYIYNITTKEQDEMIQQKLLKKQYHNNHPNSYAATRTGSSSSNSNSNSSENEDNGNNYDVTNDSIIMIDYVIRFEDLPNSLEELLGKFDMTKHWDLSTFQNSRINQHNITVNKVNNTRKLTAYNLNSETLELIHKYYHLDFELFGYEKIST